jgi:hypothetical protein
VTSSQGILNARCDRASRKLALTRGRAGANDVVAFKDGAGVMAGELHRRVVPDGGAHEVAHGRSPEVVRDPSRSAACDARFPPRLVEPLSVMPCPARVAHRREPDQAGVAATRLGARPPRTAHHLDLAPVRRIRVRLQIGVTEELSWSCCCLARVAQVGAETAPPTTSPSVSGIVSEQPAARCRGCR